MPDSSGSDFSKLRFRKAENPAFSAETLTFWHVFAAVLLALFVHSVVIGLIVDWRLKRYAAKLDADIAALLADTPAMIFAEPAPRAAPRPAQPRARPATVAGPVPALPGTIEARRQGADRACINGRIYRRLPNGWDHIGGRCRSTSQ